MEKETEYAEGRKVKLQTVSGHVGKISLFFFSCCQKSVTGDVKKWKNEKTLLSPKNHLSISCFAWEVKYDHKPQT